MGSETGARVVSLFTAKKNKPSQDTHISKLQKMMGVLTYFLNWLSA
jgi:hypothetical protein